MKRWLLCEVIFFVLSSACLCWVQLVLCSPRFGFLLVPWKFLWFFRSLYNNSFGVLRLLCNAGAYRNFLASYAPFLNFSSTNPCFFVVFGRIEIFLLPTPRFCRLAGRGNDIFPYTPHMAHVWPKFITFWAGMGRIAHFPVYTPRVYNLFIIHLRNFNLHNIFYPFLTHILNI